MAYVGATDIGHLAYLGIRANPLFKFLASGVYWEYLTQFSL
jgi:hypothetical protein